VVQVVGERDAALARERVKDELIARLEERVADLERRLGKDSSNSSKPPSTDNPFAKGEAKSSTRKPSGRRPGKQPGTGGQMLRPVTNPNEIIEVRPSTCPKGHDLSEAAIKKTVARQVVEPVAPPPPHVTEFRLHHLTCPTCGKTVKPKAPVGVNGPVQYGPRAHGLAAEVVCGHYVPLARGAKLLCALTGLNTSSGWMASVRGKAARLVEEHWLPTVFGLFKTATVVHVDETPARAAGKLAYVHIKTTDTVAVLHTGDRSKKTIDEDGILEAFAGVLVRDGYAGYEHLTGAVHALCGAHLLRDLAAITKNDTDGTQIWATAMTDTLLDALNATQDARTAGATEVAAQVRADLIARYRGAYSHGLATNRGRRSHAEAEADRLATRFKKHEELIFRFLHDLTVPFTNNLAERDLRPVKIQQKTSGGCWRTLHGLADFALVRSYLLTATKNGIETLDALTRLFEHKPYLPANC
jgi:transposase